jgi:adenine specific DNA methylase Mod
MHPFDKSAIFDKFVGILITDVYLPIFNCVLRNIDNNIITDKIVLDLSWNNFLIHYCPYD